MLLQFDIYEKQAIAPSQIYQPRALVRKVTVVSFKGDFFQNTARLAFEIQTLNGQYLSLHLKYLRADKDFVS